MRKSHHCHSRRPTPPQDLLPRLYLPCALIHLPHWWVGQFHGRRLLPTHPTFRFRLPGTFSSPLPISKSLVSAPPTVQVQAASDFHAARQATSQYFSPLVSQKESNTWKQWCTFYGWLLIPIDLRGINYPITFLGIFVEQVRQGLLSDKRKPIRKRSVDQYLRSSRQLSAAMGGNDPWHNCLGKLDFCLGH